MKRFIQKMHICLFEPRKIGLFFGEKLYKSFIHILLLSLIVVLPLIITLGVSDGISSSSYREIEKYLMEESIKTDLRITDGVLTGTKGVAFAIDEAIIFINPSDQKLELPSTEYALYHIIEFSSSGIEVSLFDNTYYTKSYIELGCNELDFSEIEKANYIELDKFVLLVDHGFENIKVQWITINSLLLLIDVFVTVIFSALILAFIVKFINPFIGFRFRFKGALDAQMISLLCLFLMMLFKTEIFRYIGIILSAIYLFKAILSILRIEVKQRVFNDKDDKEE